MLSRLPRIDRILIVYHLFEKTGWSTVVVVNGTRQNPIGDALVPFTRLFPGR